MLSHATNRIYTTAPLSKRPSLNHAAQDDPHLKLKHNTVFRNIYTTPNSTGYSNKPYSDCTKSSSWFFEINPFLAT